MILTINRPFLVPRNVLKLQIVVREPVEPVIIYLPIWGHKKQIRITQASEADIIIDSNGNSCFSQDKKKYKQLYFTGAQVNSGKTITITGKYGFWILERTKHNHLFEGLLCQDTHSTS